MQTTNTNGRPPRKNLASQLDRLDTILDTLDEGLKEAVASAVQEAIAQAVQRAIQAAITEVLTNAELQQRLHPGVADHPESGPSKLRLLWDRVKRVWVKAVNTVGKLVSKATGLIRNCASAASSWTQSACQRTKAVLRGAWMRLLLALTVAKRLRRPLIAALGVGVTVGLGCYFAGPVVASWVSGLAGFLGSLCASACNTVRRIAVSEELQNG